MNPPSDRLSEADKAALLRATFEHPPTPPVAPPVLSPQAYMEFCRFAALFNTTEKPVAFGGTQWKL
jgi:hypothetical protein